eukprot:505009_1
MMKSVLIVGVIATFLIVGGVAPPSPPSDPPATTMPPSTTMAETTTMATTMAETTTMATTIPAPTATDPPAPSCPECCSIDCAASLLDPYAEGVNFCEINNGDASENATFTYPEHNPFLKKNCQCDVTHLCEPLCDRGCEIQTAPSHTKSKVHYIADVASFVHYIVTPHVGVDVTTICFVPLPLLTAESCHSTQRQALHDKATCVTLSNCANLPNGGLFVKFEDSSGAQPVCRENIVQMTSAKNYPLLSAYVYLDKAYDYLVTSCDKIQIHAEAPCVDEDISVLSKVNQNQGIEHFGHVGH